MKRKTLYRAGRHGDTVKAVVDEKEQRVIVYYRDSQGSPRKKKFDDTGAGRKEAIAWAQTYHSERARIDAEKAAPRKITLAELWQAYTSSPAFLTQLREKSQDSYTYRFDRWMTFLTKDHCPDDTTLFDVDNYFARGLKAGIALNQLREVVKVARLVYMWGQTRKLVRTNELVLFRFKQPKDVAVTEPDEYTAEEFAKLLEKAPATDGKRWRLNVMLMLGGHQGMRANALTNLQWSDIETDGDCIVWPAKFQKNGKEFRQPLTWDAVAALETAWYWREVSGYTGEWVLFAGGGNKKLGVAIASPMKIPRPDQPATSYQRSYRKERTAEQDVSVTYQGMHLALTKAEKRAGIEHKKGRAFHGLRKMVAGNVYDGTGNADLAMEFINDRDPKMKKRYLKRRDERLEQAAAAAEGRKP